MRGEWSRMWSWSNVLTPWDVKQYAYCPVIPWIAWNYGFREPETYSMVRGREERRQRLLKLQEMGFTPPIRIDVQLYSQRFKLAGVADAITGGRRRTVVEVKAFKRKKYNHFRVQLMVYALLSEEVLGPTIRAALILGSRLKLWDVTLEALMETKRLVLKTRAAVESERPPRTQLSGKCLSCWYRRFCPYH